MGSFPLDLSPKCAKGDGSIPIESHSVKQYQRKFTIFQSPSSNDSGQRKPAHMKADLVDKAAKVITDIPVLINMVSARVRQLNQGRAPMFRVMGRMGAADIALTEIIEGLVILDDAVEGA